jgi:hypothetical protein
MTALNKRVRLAGVLGPAGSLFKRSLTLHEAFLPVTRVIARRPGAFVDLSSNQEIPMNDINQAERGWGRLSGYDEDFKRL